MRLDALRRVMYRSPLAAPALPLAGRCCDTGTSRMERVRLPPPVVLDLDVAENARLREAFIVANGVRMPLFLVAFSVVLQFVPPLLPVYRSGGNDPFDWSLLVVLAFLAVVVGTAIVAPQRWQRFLRKPELGTTVACDDAGLVIERGSKSGRTRQRHVPYAKNRSVQLTPGSLVLIGR